MTANENSEYKIPKPQPAKERSVPDLTQAWVDNFFEPSLSMGQGKPSPEMQAKVDAFIDDLIRDMRGSFKLKDTMDIQHLIHNDVPKLDFDRRNFLLEDSVPEWPSSVQELPDLGIKFLSFAHADDMKKEDYTYTYVFGDKDMQMPLMMEYADLPAEDEDADLSPEQEATIRAIIKKGSEDRKDEDGMDN